MSAILKAISDFTGVSLVKMDQQKMLGLVAGIMAVATPVMADEMAPAAGAPAAAPMECTSRFAGPCYMGAPALTVTASLVSAGTSRYGGKWSSVRALKSMVGGKMADAEVGKLTKQYGKANVASWVKVHDFVVNDALAIATKAGVKLPKPNLKGKALATTLVTAGLDKDGTFYIEYLLDKAVTHGIHEQVMTDIDKKFSPEADANYHKVTNQAMYDLAQALGAKSVKLADYH